MVDRLRQQAQDVANDAPPSIRANWLLYNATLIEVLGDLIAAQREQIASIASLRNELTVIIHAAIREYAAGDELSRIAIAEQVRTLQAAAYNGANDRKVMLQMLGAITAHIGIGTAPPIDVDAMIERRIDAAWRRWQSDVPFDPEKDL